MCGLQFKIISKKAHALHSFNKEYNNSDDISALQKMSKKSKNKFFEPTNETRNSDKTLRMMSPIHYGNAPSILVWNGEHITYLLRCSIET